MNSHKEAKSLERFFFSGWNCVDLLQARRFVRYYTEHRQNSIWVMNMYRFFVIVIIILTSGYYVSDQKLIPRLKKPAFF